MYLSLSTLVALLLMIPCVPAKCYYPSGNPSTEDVECPDRQSCCPSDAYCLSNGLCWTAGNFLLRASCSDQSWSSPDCPTTYCHDALPNSAKVMSPCSDAGLFACDYNICTRKNFTVSKGEVILRNYQQTRLGALIKDDSTTADSTSTPISSTTSASTSSPPAVSSSSSSPSSSSPSSSSPSPSSSSFPSPSSSSSTNSSSNQTAKLAGVGAGVGVPLTIALVTALALLGRERRKARRLELENARLGGSAGQKMAGIAELMEDRAQFEIMAGPMAHELQTH